MGGLQDNDLQASQLQVLRKRIRMAQKEGRQVLSCRKRRRAAYAQLRKIALLTGEDAMNKKDGARMLRLVNLGLVITMSELEKIAKQMEEDYNKEQR